MQGTGKCPVFLPSFVEIFSDPFSSEYLSAGIERTVSLHSLYNYGLSICDFKPNVILSFASNPVKPNGVGSYVMMYKHEISIDQIESMRI
jgi:hypothetical protein